MENNQILRSTLDLKIDKQKDLLDAKVWGSKDCVALEFVNWVEEASEFETDNRCVKTTIYVPFTLLKSGVQKNFGKGDMDRK